MHTRANSAAALRPRAIAFGLALGTVAACADTPAPVGSLAPGDRITQLYGSDADSGVANGRRFRLADSDAPDTGGVGFAATARVVAATRPDAVTLTVAQVGGEDRYGRTVIDIDVDGRALSALGVEQGAYQSWPHRGTRALAPKPDWCATP